MDRTEFEMKLKEKVNNEYKDFIENLKTKSADYIIADAKEIVDKSNILLVMNNLNFLTQEQLEVLYSKDNTLEEIFTDYYDFNFDYLDDYRESIINTAYLFIIFED